MSKEIRRASWRKENSSWVSTRGNGEEVYYRVWPKVERWGSTQLSQETEALENAEVQRNRTLE